MNAEPSDPEEQLEMSDEPAPADDGGGCFMETVGRLVEWGKRILKFIAMIVGGLLLLVLGVGLNHVSFGDIEEMRQLERTPEISPAAVVGGEVFVSGRADADGAMIRAPDTDTPTLYYRYVIEDYDNDDGWETVSTQLDVVDFRLEDRGTSVLVGASDDGIEFDAPQQHRRRQGNRRYTEYRIDQGEELFALGYAEKVGDEYRIGFERPGDYRPMISSGSEARHRFGLTLRSGFFVVLGVTGLLFGVFMLLRAFRVHQTALYLSVATAVVVVSLGVQGFAMMVSDLESGREAAARTLVEGNGVIEETLERRDIDWDRDFDELGSFDDSRYEALDDDERRRLAAVRKMMTRSVQRTNDNLSRFPEAVIGPLVGVRPIRELPVPEETRREIDKLEAEHEPIRLELAWGLGAIVLGLLAILGVTRSGLGKIGLKRTIEDVPTSPISGVVYGLTELKGTVEIDEHGRSLRSPMTKSECVYYRYRVKKKVKEGKKTKWKVIKDVSGDTPFYCRDETGRMSVDPEGAECSAKRKKYRRRGSYKYYEWTIRPGDNVYVLGPATVDPKTHDRLEIREEDDDTPFVVSSLSESELMQKKASTGFSLLNVGTAATIMAGMGITGVAVSFSPMMYWTMALVSCGYLFVVLGFLYYNDLVFLRDRVDRAWSNIDVALKKRFDLIDNLAGIVDEYLDHEQRLQTSITRARNLREKADAKPSNEVLEAGRQVRDELIGRVEDYPELQGDELVEDLMETLREVENDIALMRDGYNDTVERYNSRLQRIPEVVVGRLCRFQRADFLWDRES